MLTARQSNRLTAYENVETALLEDPTPYTDDEGMKEIVGEISTHLAALKPLRKQGVRGRKGGAAGDKTEAKQLLADIGAEVAGDLFSFGTKTKDRTLQAGADYNASDLFDLRGTRLVDVSEHLLDLATAQAPVMDKLAISPARRTELREAIANFGGKKNKPRQQQIDGQGVALGTGGHFAAIAELLQDRLQRALRKYKRRNNDFFNRVSAAREVIDLPGSHSSGPATPPA